MPAYYDEKKKDILSFHSEDNFVLKDASLIDLGLKVETHEMNVE